VPRPQAEQDNDLGEVTTTADLQGGQARLPEIEVDTIQEIRTPESTEDRVVIRMNTTLEDFTYGNPNKHWKLEAGKRYMVPRHIAEYLDGLEYLWH
jgi:hypothetical protein